MSPESDLARAVGRAYGEIGGQPSDPEVGRLGRELADLLGRGNPNRRAAIGKLADRARDWLTRLIARR